MNRRVLVVDDEKIIVKGLKYSLEQDDIEVDVAYDGIEALEKIENNTYCVVLLDIMLPGMTGTEVCQRVREFSDVPIIMLTAKESEMDYSIGITSGSDDYMIKPFSPSILIMRIKALFRRIDLERSENTKPVVEELKYEDLFYSESKHAIMCGSKSLGLTEMELDFMKYMLSRSTEAISREDFLDQVWGLDAETESRVVDETVRRLRRKLRTIESKVTINTVWGFGYQLGVVE